MQRFLALSAGTRRSLVYGSPLRLRMAACLASSATRSSPSDTRAPQPQIDFSDPKKAFESKSMLQLVRAWAVFQLCGWKWLVAHSDQMVRVTTRFLGKSVLKLALKPTFFGHFCAGEDEETIRPTIEYLRANGIGSILDYAAEADVDEQEGKNKASTASSSSSSSSSPLEPSFAELTAAGTSQPARTFEYEGEEKCNQNLAIFQSCISAVHNVTPEGFAAVKLTALGPPALLERLSTALVETKALFNKIDSNRDGFVDFAEFQAWYHTLLGTPVQDDEARRIFDGARNSVAGVGGQYKNEKGLDYVAWSSMWTLRDLWDLLRRSKQSGPLGEMVLSNEEMVLVNNMYKRIHTVGEFASQHNVRLMIDAEQTYFQPAIDHATLELQHKYNKTFPTIFGTYQCYLKDTPSRVLFDINRASKYGYLFAAKIVRGAYMKIERDRASARGEASPINDTLQDTHNCYHHVMQLIMSQPQRNLVIATHNQASIEHAVKYMWEHDIDASKGGVYFAQLLGMADHLTFSLGRNGYKAYKYVPYGPVHEVVPYLIRRAQENSDMLAGGNGAREAAMAMTEITRRLTHWA